MRRRNWLRTGDELVLAKAATAGQDVGSLLVESSGLAECLRLVEEKLGWHIKRGVVNNGRLRRGVGVARGIAVAVGVAVAVAVGVAVAVAVAVGVGLEPG